ncbi:HAD family hydrolase [Lacticaseibacillus zhaodongensis]|uniref:HAD family hydrolase n=1 Tax=Lacticaseibacillus zhaodongensis TaxID=2668065 RepID=UPI0012D33875|nr:HAD family phosphatase [Lacticaseibacillus zhaodongensis]
MKKALIFDMDGVLVDSEPFYFKRRMRFFKMRGIKPDSTDIHDYLGMSNDQVWAALVNDPSKRQQLWQDYAAFQDANPIDYRQVLNSGVKELLRYLKDNGYGVALASAGIPEEIMRMVNECQIKQFFDVILSGEKLPANKPAPDIYLKAIEQLGVSREESLVIEDSYNGIAAAKNAGIETWAIDQSDMGVDQSAADKIVADIPEIQQLLQN